MSEDPTLAGFRRRQKEAASRRKSTFTSNLEEAMREKVRAKQEPKPKTIQKVFNKYLCPECDQPLYCEPHIGDKKEQKCSGCGVTSKFTKEET